MNQNCTQIAVMSDTKEIVAVGRTFSEMVANADATGIWDQAPGTVAPYFYTSASSKDFWGAWFREGFWADKK